MRYRADVDGLRSIAVVPVVLFHAGLGFPGGFVGVDVFFVISGYLIARLLAAEIEDGRYSLLGFYERRARRLFPALFTMLAATLAAAALWMTPDDLENVARSAGAATLFLANVHFFLETGYFNEGALLKPLLHTWSLAVEEQHYLFFPPILWLCLRKGGRRAAATAMALATAASFALCVWGTARYADAAFYLPATRAWELLAGALLVFAPRMRAGPATDAIGLAGIATILWVVLTWSESASFPGAQAAVPVLATVAILAAGDARGRDGAAARLLSLAPAVWIGKLSYSLYLWHWPVIVFAAYGAEGPMSVERSLACVGLSLLLAMLSLHLIERPFRTPRRAPRRAGVFIWTGAGGALVMTAAAATLIGQGWPQRLPEGMQALPRQETLVQDAGDCHGVTPGRLRRGAVCVRGAAGASPDFVLVGDSHAGAISPGLFAAAEDLGRAGWQITGPGLNPLPDRWRLRRGGPTPHARALLAFLEAHPDARTVVISAYWFYHATGGAYRYGGSVWADDAYDGEGLAYNPRSLDRALRRMAARFPERRIVVLDDLASGPALHLASHARRWLTSGLAPAWILPRAEAEAQRDAYAPLFRAAAAQVGNLEYHPVHAALCDARGCPLFDRTGRALYRDGDHLSVDGAMALREGLRAALHGPRVPPQARIDLGG